MTERFQRATRLGTRVGLWVAAFSVVKNLISWRLGDRWSLDLGNRLFDWVTLLLLVPAASFALFFVLVFVLAFAFPPATDRPSARLDFPGAGKVVWPIIGLLVAATVYIVIALR